MPAAWGNRNRQTHGMTKTTTYRSWRAMLNRCYNQKVHAYDRYGGRGIQVCDEWRISFVAFLRDMGERPEGLSLDRWPDVNGHYEPSNCRWATRSEQTINQRTAANAVLIEYGGKTQTLSAWAREVGIDTATLDARRRKGWSVERMLTVPADEFKKISLNGQRRTAAEWGALIGVNAATIRRRMRSGWPIDKALTEKRYSKKLAQSRAQCE